MSVGGRGTLNPPPGRGRGGVLWWSQVLDRSLASTMRCRKWIQHGRFQRHPSTRRRRRRRRRWSGAGDIRAAAAAAVLRTSQGDFANVAIRHRPTPSPHLLMPHSSSRIYLMPRLSLERSNEADGEWNEMARVLPHLRISPKCHRKDPVWLRELAPARDCELTQLTWSNFTQPE